MLCSHAVKWLTQKGGTAPYLQKYYSITGGIGQVFPLEPQALVCVK